MMKKTYLGSCHCGAIKFECDLDLAAGTRRCNCSFCLKSRFWKVFAMRGEFRLLQGEAALSDYQAAASEWPKGDVHHYFCKNCGTHPFSKGYLEMEPFNGTFHAVNIAALDSATDAELAAAHVQYEDGRGNNWDVAPEITSYL
jgi:hypothetical protein